MQKKVKIMMVDDDPDFLFLYSKRLARHGMECIAVSTPQEGLEKALSEKPDLVLLDLNLPKMSGFGFLREMKQVEALKDLTIVVLTAIQNDEVSDEAMDLGAVDYLTKQVSDYQLIRTIQAHL